MKVIVSSNPEQLGNRDVNLKFISDDGHTQVVPSVHFNKTRDVIDAVEKLSGEKVDTYSGDFMSGGTNGDYDRMVQREINKGNLLAKALRTGDWNDVFSPKEFQGYKRFTELGKANPESVSRFPTAVYQEMNDLNSDFYKMSPEEWEANQKDLKEAADKYNMSVRDFINNNTDRDAKLEYQAWLADKEIGDDGLTRGQRWNLLASFKGIKAADDLINQTRNVQVYDRPDGTKALKINFDVSPDRTNSSRKAVVTRRKNKGKEFESEQRRTSFIPEEELDKLMHQLVQGGGDDLNTNSEKKRILEEFRNKYKTASNSNMLDTDELKNALKKYTRGKIGSGEYIASHKAKQAMLEPDDGDTGRSAEATFKSNKAKQKAFKKKAAKIFPGTYGINVTKEMFDDDNVASKLGILYKQLTTNDSSLSVDENKARRDKLIEEALRDKDLFAAGVRELTPEERSEFTANNPTTPELEAAHAVNKAKQEKRDENRAFDKDLKEFEADNERAGKLLQFAKDNKEFIEGEGVNFHPQYRGKDGVITDPEEKARMKRIIDSLSTLR